MIRIGQGVEMRSGRRRTLLLAAGMACVELACGGGGRGSNGGGDEERTAAPELNDMLIDNSSLAPLAAFLRALNEDYR
jgi:hypothetical protein